MGVLLNGHNRRLSIWDLCRLKIRASEGARKITLEPLERNAGPLFERQNVQMFSHYGGGRPCGSRFAPADTAEWARQLSKSPSYREVRPPDNPRIDRDPRPPDGVDTVEYFERNKRSRKR